MLDVDSFAAENEARQSADPAAYRELEERQQRAYESLDAARRAQGVARIVMGLHLATIQDTEGWKGRSGASSFRRFLLEEGLEPTAAYQYMAVARAFLLDHSVLPERIAMVSMRTLVIAAKFLTPPEEVSGVESNVDQVVAIVTTMPSAEALQSLKERYELNEAAVEAAGKPRLSRPVASILTKVDDLTMDARAELYQALRFTPPASSASARPPALRVRRIPPVIPPEPPLDLSMSR
jgi:hypothetical protein